MQRETTGVHTPVIHVQSGPVMLRRQELQNLNVYSITVAGLFESFMTMVIQTT